MWFLFFPTCPNFFSPACYHFPLYLKNKSFGWALICNNNNQNFNKCSSPSPEEQIQEGPQSSGLSLSQMFSFIIRKWPFVDMKRKDWTSTSQPWFLSLVYYSFHLLSLQLPSKTNYYSSSTKHMLLISLCSQLANSNHTSLRT